MIKAAFFDLDGTLLSFTTHQVPASTIKAFDLLHRHGVRTFLSTGRPAILVPSLPLAFDGHITMNGGYVYVGEQLLFSQPMTQNDCDNWIDYAKDNTIGSFFYTADAMFASHITPQAQEVCDMHNIPMPPQVSIDEMRGKEFMQIIAIMDPSRDDEVRQRMPDSCLPRWSPLFTDIVSLLNSKANGIKCVCHHFDIDPAETVAFGDGANDIKMFKFCGTSVAMGNANDEVKSHAEYVTTSVDDDGVLNAVEYLLGTH